MTRPELRIIAISYAKRVFDENSRERARMREYATLATEYHVIVFSRKNEGLPSLVTDGQLTLYATNTHTKIGALIAAYQIGKSIIRKQKNASFIVTSQDPFETSLVGRALTRAGRSVVHQVQMHGDLLGAEWRKESLLNTIRYLYGRFVVHRAQRIRVVSERIKRSLLELNVAPEIITVLPIQADLESFLTIGARRDQQAESRILLYVGRFSSEKNLPLLLRAFSTIAPQFPEWKLRLMGEGGERARVSSLIEALGIASQVELLPWTNEVPAAMAEAEVFCLASNHEGWAMVLIEAMAAGLPVITTDVGCAGEVVKNNEQGLVVPIRDEAAYANALKIMLSDAELRKKFSRTAFRTAESYTQTKSAYLLALQSSFIS